MNCKHAVLSFEPSENAYTAGYVWPNVSQRIAATHSKSSTAPAPSASLFPAPLILPNDDLSLDPRCPPQSMRSWLRLKDRNQVTPERNIIYIAAPPEIDPTVDFIQSWTQPEKQESSVKIMIPSIEDITEYITAFYHGLPVRQLPPPQLCFTSWDTTTPKARLKSKATKTRFIGLNTSTECVRIRTRPSTDGAFPSQLNLDDLLDAAISMLPDDAYALLLLVNHDLFESSDDEFVCGRAYGGSRVAVVSTARYHPLLDIKHNIERNHAWPASHCEKYMRSVCTDNTLRPKKKAKNQDAAVSHPPSSKPGVPEISPMHAALSSFKEKVSLPPTSRSSILSNVWLGRVCRTASHELGHCFGMEHCIYYACSMQGSASLAEDARQPPYLCPVDLAKMLHATGTTAAARYQALLVFCEKYQENSLFAAYAAWIRTRLSVGH